MDSGRVILRLIVVVVVFGLIYLAYALSRTSPSIVPISILAIDAAVIAIGIVFEKQRYRPKVDLSKGEWTRTGEKFKDPTSGKNLEVVFNPKTGERDYIEI